MATINALSIIPVLTASCSVMGDYAIKKKQNKSWKNKKVGDIVLYDFNGNGTSDHTGILEKINSDGSITVIEGNTDKNNDANGGCVQRRTRYKWQVNYFVRPKYTKTITAKMVLDTARAELGTKEKPAGSNMVKYNTWYYGRKVRGDAYPWCMVFVCWCFAHVQTEKVTPSVEPKSDTKTDGTYNGAFPIKIIKKGDTGTDVKRWQKYLRWMGYTEVIADSDFGKVTKKYTKKAQKKLGFVGKDVDGIVGSKTIKAAKAYKKTVKKKTDKQASQNTPQELLTLDIRGFKKVIDISYWQSKSDLKKAKKDGVDGVIIRTSYTSQSKFSLNPDSRFETHLKHALEAGLPVGVYHYSQALSESEAKKEAAYILKIIEPYKGKIKLPVVIDWEFGGRLNATSARKLGKSGATKVIKAFCEKVKAAGYVPMIYANYSAFSSYLDYESLKKSYKIWLAQYNKTASLKYDLWQYTSGGSIAGVPGRVDVNRGCGVSVKKNGPELAVDWARKIAASGKYGYKKWKNDDPKTKQCPICHDLKGIYCGWNCIGFISACYHHGAGLKEVTCSCSGLGTNNFFTNVTEASWRKRNGENWKMIGSGKKGGTSLTREQLQLGDVLICYDKDGIFHHIAMYTGGGKYIDCTNTAKPHIAERSYTNLLAKYHVTRAFRYTG